jgi:ubiquinone/menaquinone biosynthesis C-methylase UbiE
MKIFKGLKRIFSDKLPLSNKANPPLPKYLTETYWWAYVHPNAVWFFERQWLVNLILWGNFYKLRDLALSEFQKPSKILQVACVYGNFTEQLAKSMPDSDIHVVDVAEIQLNNLKSKISSFKNVELHHQDSSSLKFPNESFDNVILFFLLHEMPEEVREKTVKEAIRVLKPGGKAVFVDYHKAAAYNPFKYIMIPVLKWLEPFALDLWKKDIKEWMPPVSSISKQTYFGGLYQKVLVIK